MADGYAEVADQDVRSLRTRLCRLRTGDGEPVAELGAVSFRLRFGAVAVAAEGIGGVETQPEFRRQGHMSRLLRRALDGMAQRVDVAFVSEAIEGLYVVDEGRGLSGEGKVLVSSPGEHGLHDAGSDFGRLHALGMGFGVLEEGRAQ
ncbi:GNAT family N-acetyltransferase [Streptomyces tibetensis]